ncbi:dTMP kinase [Methylomarinovum caldicuralii]|uniref:Thymidylate kinase n=1 Tax=Methylomarinovum caldicuralii TaxID=438856 RepID=A0AAU9CRW7_9GAMM|nr:dTMP kinase [Methylomarinovum caldicuralii]BCX82272.1 dTMP kinase [Methylomarinovum caldicuralii]
MKRGRFITLEGGEGVGKTTNLAFIRDFLQQQGIEVVVTREPGGVPVAETLRTLVLETQGLAAEAELLLIFAGRVQHLRDLIEPALASGRWVVCDRFVDASYAYQGGGRGLDWERIEYLERWLVSRQPDLTLLLDAPVEVGLARARARGDTNRFEEETVGFLERVRQAYLRRWRQAPQRIRRVDATLPLAQVRQAIAAELQRLLER